MSRSKHRLERAVEKFALEKNPNLFSVKPVAEAKECALHTLKSLGCVDDLTYAVTLSAIYGVRDRLPDGLHEVRSRDIVSPEMLADDFDELSYYAWTALLMCGERRRKGDILTKIDHLRRATPEDKRAAFEELLLEQRVEAEIGML